jgi:hypothetical protein
LAVEVVACGLDRGFDYSAFVDGQPGVEPPAPFVAARRHRPLLLHALRARPQRPLPTSTGRTRAGRGLLAIGVAVG